jgi:hypothetical protein
MATVPDTVNLKSASVRCFWIGRTRARSSAGGWKTLSNACPPRTGNWRLRSFAPRPAPRRLTLKALSWQRAALELVTRHC